MQRHLNHNVTLKTFIEGFLGFRENGLKLGTPGGTQVGTPVGTPCRGKRPGRQRVGRRRVGRWWGGRAGPVRQFFCLRACRLVFLPARACALVWAGKVGRRLGHRFGTSPGRAVVRTGRKAGGSVRGFRCHRRGGLGHKMKVFKNLQRTFKNLQRTF